MKVTAEAGPKGLGSRGLRVREGGPGGRPWPVLKETLPGRDQREALESRQVRSRSRAVGRGRDEGENWSERCWETEILVVDTPPMKRGDLLRRPCPWPACDCVGQ